VHVSMNKKVVTLIIAIVIVGALSLSIGSANIFTLDAAERNTIMFDIRLPRVLMAIVVGTSLVMSGWVLQVVLRNPMADSFTLGMANAAILGSALTVSLGWPIFFQPVVSVLFGLLSLVIVLALAFTIDKNFANETLI